MCTTRRCRLDTASGACEVLRDVLAAENGPTFPYERPARQPTSHRTAFATSGETWVAEAIRVVAAGSSEGPGSSRLARPPTGQSPTIATNGRNRRRTAASAGFVLVPSCPKAASRSSVTPGRHRTFVAGCRSLAGLGRLPDLEVKRTSAFLLLLLQAMFAQPPDARIPGEQHRADHDRIDDPARR